jgi:citrate lyase alpha subunit
MAAPKVTYGTDVITVQIPGLMREPYHMRSRGEVNKLINDLIDAMHLVWPAADRIGLPNGYRQQ